MGTRAVRSAAGTLGVAVLATGLLAGSASAAPGGPVVAYSGVSADHAWGLYAVDSGTGRQWHVADGLAVDASWSPDGSRLAWIAYDADDLGHVQVAAADGSDRRQVDGDGDSRSLAWSSRGTLAWFHRSAWAPTDCTTDDRLVRPAFVLQTPDGARRALGDVAPTASDLTFSPDGTTVVWRESGPDVCAQAPGELVVADVASGRRTVVAGAQDTTGLAFSPDSTALAVTRATPEGGDVVLVDLAARTARQVVTDAAGETSAVFVGDGTDLAAVRTTATDRRLVMLDRTANVVRDLGAPPEFVEQLVASTDRASVVVAGRSLPSADGAYQDTQLWRQPLDGSAATLLSTNGAAAVFEAAVTAWGSDAPVLPRRTRSR
ncbi:PD40 domain-containing protein [Kineococcus rhizosphaerae]|uniref:WD40 repeat protein n=1 Tax=Kineococcus rhizosphaerae TaxID=559628 RepID=A0A2T0R6T5_9ACTN|nr:PD40 domain-containing protein [Kineococcus rhizosphaerae]PRY16886.1 WD40 repeat protein [Kineococcus rhizosphaerae]